MKKIKDKIKELINNLHIIKKLTKENRNLKKTNKEYEKAIDEKTIEIMGLEKRNQELEEELEKDKQALLIEYYKNQNQRKQEKIHQQRIDKDALLKRKK